MLILSDTHWISVACGVSQAGKGSGAILSHESHDTQWQIMQSRPHNSMIHFPWLKNVVGKKNQHTATEIYTIFRKWETRVFKSKILTFWGYGEFKNE